jgi:hypothetical protein
VTCDACLWAGLEALIACLDSGAVQRLLQRLAGQHSEAVRHAGFLLGLADTAAYLVVDRFVMSRFSAQQAPEHDDSIESFCDCEGTRGGRNLPCARHAHNLDLLACCAAAQQSIERTLEQPFGDDSVPARHDDSEPHAGGGEIAFDRDRFAT